MLERRSTNRQLRAKGKTAVSFTLIQEGKRKYRAGTIGCYFPSSSCSFCLILQPLSGGKWIFAAAKQCGSAPHHLLPCPRTIHRSSESPEGGIFHQRTYLEVFRIVMSVLVQHYCHKWMCPSMRCSMPCHAMPCDMDPVLWVSRKGNQASQSDPELRGWGVTGRYRKRSKTLPTYNTWLNSVYIYILE